MNTRIAMIVILATLGTLASCGDDDGPAGPGTDEALAKELTSQGWRQFESALFDSAKASFEDAIAADSAYADAHNGRGWSALFLGLPPANAPLDNAISSFAQAIALELYAADPQAGLAIAHQSEAQYQPAVAYGEEALDLEPTYAFRHRHSVNYLDIHIVLAQAYFGLGEESFPQAQAHVDIIEPANGLDPDDSTTWKVDLDRDGEIEPGETFSSYTEALMELIELLAREIFG